MNGAGYVEPYRPRDRASVPRFQAVRPEEARLLALTAPPFGSQFTLPFFTDDVVESCPSWLLEMYDRAQWGRPKITGGMPYAFSLVIGALAHTPVSARTGGETRLYPLSVGEVAGWLHPTRWNQRSRDWHLLEAALEEMPSYRVTLCDRSSREPLRYWVALGEGLPRRYRADAVVKFRTRVPASAARGMRVSWPLLVRYRPHATLTRAYLSTAALLDRSARAGEPLRREDPEAGRAAILPGRDIARFLGMADTKQNRYRARKALGELHRSRVIDLQEIARGYRVFGPRKMRHD